MEEAYSSAPLIQMRAKVIPWADVPVQYPRSPITPESDREVSHEPDEDGPWWDEGRDSRGEAEDFEHHDDGLGEVSDWFPEEA